MKQKTPLLVLVLGVFALALISACGDTKIYNELPTAPTAPTTSNQVKLTFRVNGNFTSVRIRYSDSINGLNQVVTALPYFNSVYTSGDTLYLSLDATPIIGPVVQDNPFITAQILVNDVLFREGSSFDYTTQLTVSGTWRK